MVEGRDHLFLFAEQLADMVGLAAGQRQRCIDAGFSPEAADQMGVHVHQLCIDIIRSSTNKRDTLSS